MAVYDDRSERNWPLPHRENRLVDDVERIRDAFIAADDELTAADEKIARKAEVICLNNFIISNDGWQLDEGGLTGYNYFLNIENDLFNADMIPFLNIDPLSFQIAIDAGLSSIVGVYDKYMTVRASKIPADRIKAALLLVNDGEIEEKPFHYSDLATEADIDDVLSKQYDDDDISSTGVASDEDLSDIIVNMYDDDDEGETGEVADAEDISGIIENMYNGEDTSSSSSSSGSSSSSDPTIASQEDIDDVLGNQYDD